MVLNLIWVADLWNASSLWLKPAANNNDLFLTFCGMPSWLFELDNLLLPSYPLTNLKTSPDLPSERILSRMHAGLRRQGDTLVLCDMGSLNHTYINGQRLHAHEVRVLHNGDEIRFGQLVTRVYFRPQ
jgi:hypothetical protein